ncbi:MAG: YbfB/YjiJ family MFS transporter, partial [Candidatus Bathyarchaeia archaeon]
MGKVEETPHVYLIIFSGHLAVLGSLGFARFGYSMILPSMKEGLGLSYTQMGLMASGNFSGYMVFAILGGLLASKYGARVVMTISLTLVGASMLLTGLAE